MSRLAKMLPKQHKFAVRKRNRCPLCGRPRGFMRKYYDQMGMLRYVIFTHLLLWMVLIPIKMYLRWMFNLKYFVAIPEFLFNI